MQQVFGIQPSTNTADLLASISGFGLGISLQTLNATWLRTASADSIQAELLEELGHAIDHRLNGNNDTPGDEGAIFSALIRNDAVPSVEQTQDDHHTLVIHGQRIAVEAAAPELDVSASPQFTTIPANTGVPSGTVGTLVSALIDSGGSLNNFSNSDWDSPAIAITGTNLNGGTLYYSTNNGTSWSDVGTVSETSARVLYADSNTRLAFVPATDFTVTTSDLITFKACDRTRAESISSTPTLTATYDTTGTCWGVTLSADGNTAFIADGSSGLQIIDVSNPASPSSITPHLQRAAASPTTSTANAATSPITPALTTASPPLRAPSLLLRLPATPSASIPATPSSAMPPLKPKPGRSPPNPTSPPTAPTPSRPVLLMLREIWAAFPTPVA